MDSDKRIQALRSRLRYVSDIFGERELAGVNLLQGKIEEFVQMSDSRSALELRDDLARLEDLFSVLERRLDEALTPMDRVRIVRHPHRFCLKDILENVYDNYAEIGGQDEHSIDPGMLIARAYFSRRVGRKVVNQPVMVIGQEKGHGEEFRNGGSVKPWGNAKALHYMKVAETENIPIHSFVFTPGAFPIEDYPGAAQQIARNIHDMAGLRVPIVSVISEGGSGGAEAIGLSDLRLMFSHGYYSVISPEGAAAIEGGLRVGQRASPELIAQCAERLRITAEDCRRMGFVDRIVAEPHLGARPDHHDFFRRLRLELIQATNEVAGAVRGVNPVRAFGPKGDAGEEDLLDAERVYMRWELGPRAKDRLLWQRHQKYLSMSQWAYRDRRTPLRRFYSGVQDMAWSVMSSIRYDFLGRHRRRIMDLLEEIDAGARLLKYRLRRPFRRLRVIGVGTGAGAADPGAEARQNLTRLSCPDQGVCRQEDSWIWVSPRSREDRAVSCPGAVKHGCPDQWAPDLFGEFAGVCSSCGHHFPMEYQWYLHNVLNFADSFEFHSRIESANPLQYEGLDLKLSQARNATKLRSACITFESSIEGVNAVVAMLVAPFRGGSVGAAEGEKFVRAAERARKKHYPFIAFVHGTAGIRIQEGLCGLIQMPRCTMAVRRYMEAGGLYMVIYDTNSYAGPVASFLGCSPYQFAMRSSNLGFAGPGVIQETTGIAVPPNYHDARQALSRGHIQGIWDRRELKRNLHLALLTMGGRNLYYR